MVETRAIGSFFDIRKDISFHNGTVLSFGQKLGEKICLKVLRDNLISQVWEATPTLDPYEYGYKIIREFGGLRERVVHGSDFYSGKDILECIDPKIRRGKEYEQALIYKKKLLEAEVGDSIIWISPAKKNNENDVEYPHTQVCVAEKTNEKSIHIRQFQIDTNSEALIVNTLTGRNVLDKEASLDQIITACGVTKTRLTTGFIKDVLNKFNENKLSVNFQELLEDCKKLALFGARKLLGAIKAEFDAQIIKRIHSRIFSRLLKAIQGDFLYDFPAQIITNCGLIDFWGFQAPQEPVLILENKKTWCLKCKIDNCCTKTCYKCKGGLTRKTS